VTNGSGATSSIFFGGGYSTGNFSLASDGHGGTLVTDPPTSQQNILAPPRT
jgi:hypothetical protein